MASGTLRPVLFLVGALSESQLSITCVDWTVPGACSTQIHLKERSWKWMVDYIAELRGQFSPIKVPQRCGSVIWTRLPTGVVLGINQPLGADPVTGQSPSRRVDGHKIEEGRTCHLPASDNLWESSAKLVCWPRQER